MMEDAQVYDILLKIEKIVQSSEYSKWQASFIDEHVDKFEYADENKLEYTTVFQMFEEGVEKQIVAGLPDAERLLPAFMEALPAYLESEAGKKEETGRSVSMLMQMSEFSEFKDMMMYVKKERDLKQENPGDLLPDGDLRTGDTVVGVDGLLDMCAALAASGDSDQGWETCYQNEWLKIDKKEVEPEVRKSKNEMYLRGVMTMNMTYSEVLDMMLFFGDRRKLWDKNFGGVEVFNDGDIIDDDEVVVKSHINMGTLMHMVGMPRSLLIKYIRRWDTPKAGMVTTAMVPWDIKTQSIDHNNSILTVKCNTFKPHPSIPDKAVIISLEINKMGGMPKWALKIIMSSTAPGLMSGLEKRYIENVRKANKSMDMTPEGRKKRKKGAWEW